MWPDAPPSKGTAAIRAAWVELMKTPGITANIIVDRLQVAQSGDVAFDEGHVDLEVDTPQGRAKDRQVPGRLEESRWRVEGRVRPVQLQRARAASCAGEGQGEMMR
jgi:ketosteroid isomerase-like protein